MIPIFIKNMDTHYAVTMAEQLIQAQLEGVGRITILDTGSTEPDLPDLYRSLVDRHGEDVVKVVLFGENFGIHSLWNVPYDWGQEVSDFYVCTDSDLNCSSLPSDTLAMLAATMKADSTLIKAGLALRLDDLTPDNSLEADYIREEQAKDWERCYPLSFRGRSIEAYGATIDTTFALYRKGSNWGGYLPSVRVAGEYQVRHVPWYYTDETVPPDFLHYLSRILSGIPYGWTGRLKEHFKARLA